MITSVSTSMATSLDRTTFFLIKPYVTNDKGKIKDITGTCPPWTARMTTPLTAKNKEILV